MGGATVITPSWIVSTTVTEYDRMVPMKIANVLANAPATYSHNSAAESKYNANVRDCGAKTQLRTGRKLR